MAGYGTAPYGTGPYGSVGGVIIPFLIPLGGYGGFPYGTGPYGSMGGFGAPVIPISGGYGGTPYGHGPYGSIGASTDPSVSGARSIDGFTIEVLFGTEMAVDDLLLDPGSYTLTPLVGAAPSTCLSVEVGLLGSLGATSVILRHTGTTLGGTYLILVVGPYDLGGTHIEALAPLNEATLLCKGSAPPYTASAISGSEVLLEFEQEILDEAGFTPGVLQTDAYEFETDYPQTIFPQSVTHPYLGDASQIKLDILGMTSVDYTVVLSPALAFDYDASVLPLQDTQFQAQMLGSGSSSVGAMGLALTPTPGHSYGWRFLDTSSKLSPGSAFRASVTLDLSLLGALPDDSEPVLWMVSDGTMRVEIHLRKILGDPTIEVVSGTFLHTAPLAWESQGVLLEVVRNQKADTICVLADGEVLVSDVQAAFTGGAGFPAGIQVLVDPDGMLVIKDLLIQEVKVTASTTVYSTAWNFFHLQEALLQGNDDLTVGVLETQKGPLVKGWGDATPASKQDVHLFVNGEEVEVALVNPYVGKIYPTIPIPKMPPGTITITVDYIWFPGPSFPLLFNVEGASLNQSACPDPCPTPGNGPYIGGTYQPPGKKFPMGVVLQSPPVHAPLLRSPRHVGLEHAYTSSFNSPTTLLFNQDPHRIAKPYADFETDPTIVYYEGTIAPPDNGWTLIGSQDLIPDPPPAGIVSDALEAGYYQVFKNTSGTYGNGHVTVFAQTFDARYPENIILVSRLQVQRDGLVPHGVFTGVGFGAHTNDHLYLVGALLIDDVQHLGVLTTPAQMDEASSWTLLYTTEVQVLGAFQCAIPTSEIPTLVSERVLSGDRVRFRVTEGPQAGVYVVTSISAISAETSVLKVSTAFPGDYKLWGQAYAQISFETPWDGDGFAIRPTTYRLVIQNDRETLPRGRATLYVGGAISGKALEIEGVPNFAIPADSILTLPAGPEGMVFWGSMDRQAQNLSAWHFVRYGIEPLEPALHSRGIVVATELGSLPQDDPNHIWYVTQDYGQTFIDSTGGRMVLEKASSASAEGVSGADLTMGYARQEPFLTRMMHIDFDAAFSVEQGTLGAGDLLILIRDGTREVRLGTILYEETASERVLLQMASRSLCGLLSPEDQGWVGSSPINNRMLTPTIASSWSTELDDAQNGGRIVTLQAAFAGVSPGETGISLEVAVGAPSITYGVGLRWRDDELVIYGTLTQNTVATIPFAWNDTGSHSYRITADMDVGALTLMVDDEVLGAWSVSDFDVIPLSTEYRLTWGVLSTTGTILVSATALTEIPPASALRTLGVFVGGEGIDAWELPRTDDLEVPNSDLAALIEPMDWRELIKLRIHRDPSWGVTVLRTDLPPPPYFTGQWSTQSTQPSAGWINVEYRRLPSTTGWGMVAFGGLDADSITKHRWRRVRYRMYKYPSKDIVYKHPQVLNRANVLTSGEVLRDTSVEVYTVLSTNATQVDLTAVNIVADKIFLLSYVFEGQTVVLSEDSYVFNAKTQTITITSGSFAPLVGPSDPITDEPGPDIDPNTIHVPVTVSFSPGKPYTLTYVCSQPLLDGVTLLNEGTPPMVLTQTADTMTKIVWGSAWTDPLDLLNEEDFIFNDPYRYLDSFWPAGAVYENVTRCEKSAGETCLLSPFCDENVIGAAQAESTEHDPWDIGNGLILLEMGGLMFWDPFITFSDGPKGPFQPPPAVFLKASGDSSGFGGELQGAILFTPLGPDSKISPPPLTGWSVFGVLYDTISMTTETLYFGVSGED